MTLYCLAPCINKIIHHIIAVSDSGKKAGLNEKLHGVSNVVIFENYEGEMVKIDCRKVSKFVNKVVNKQYKNPVEREEWYQQEKKTQISLQINLVIDKCCKELHLNINKVQRKKIFDSVGAQLNPGEMELDMVCAQGSIKQTLLRDKYLQRLKTHLYKDVIDRGMRNQLENSTDNKVTDQLCKLYFNIDLAAIRALALDVTRAQLSIKERVI